MTIIFFFYGLAFVVMGIVIFAMPKRNDFLNLSDNLWLAGLFGITHGFNEWIDLFILKGGPFDVQMLKVIGGLLLPISFIFLVAFAIQVISRDKPEFKWLKFLWIICLLVWALAYILGEGFLIAGIAARYFICLPGTFLTAFALHLRFSKSDKKQLPKIIYISIQSAILTFILYGVFSGLVVPKANFLLASVINYPNFSNFFRVQVQLFRMSCAIILAVCFLGITGLFYYQKGKVKWRGGIRRKITLLICLSIFIVAAAGISLGYFWGFNLLRNTVGDGNRKMADILATSISGMFDEDIEQIETYSTDPVWKNAIRKSNLKYKTMETDAIQSYLMDIDSKWTTLPDDSPLIKEYLGSDVSIELKEILKEEKDIAEIFITDRFGGLVASSGRTSDFYQADEEWWQEAFNDGKGKVFIGDIELDKSSNVLAMPFAVPVRDKKNKVIGVCKAVVNIDIFFKPLREFRIGKTGHAVLVNQEGNIVFHEGTETLGMRFCSEKDFERLLESKNKRIVIDNPYIHKGKIFITFAKVSHPILLERGINWKIFVDQDAKEVFAPVNALIFQGAILAIFLIIISIPLGFIFGRIFVKPIRKLYNATKKIAEGDSDYKIKVKTGDEVEELANSFRDMISKLKETQNQLIQAEKLNAVGRLASGVAHEVKNPLGIIIQGINYLEKKSPSEQDDILETFDMIKDSVKRADKIVGSLLDFSRATKVVLQPADIGSVIEDSLSLVKHEFKLENIEIIKEIKKDIPKIPVDKNRMEQVFINVFLNAVQAMPEGGKIIIRSYDTQLEKVKNGIGRREDDSFKAGERAVIVEIEDTGAGISEENLKKIFDPFFTTKSPGRGTGLGLSVSRNIISMHRGLIDIESQVNKGTKVTVTLKITRG